MSIITTFIKFCRADGMDPEEILRRVEIMEVAVHDMRSPYEMPMVDEAAERRRARDRERARIRRQSADNPQTPKPLLSSSLPSNEFKKEESKKERKGSGKTNSIEGWSLTEEHIAYGFDLGLFRDDVRELAEDMRLWATSNAHRPIARKKCWDATFQGWMRREAKKRKTDVQADKSLLGACDRNHDRILAKMREFDLPIGGNIEGESNVLMLPQARRDGPGQLFSGGSGGIGRIPAGSGPLGDGPARGTTIAKPIPTDREGGPGRLRGPDGTRAANGPGAPDTS